MADAEESKENPPSAPQAQPAEEATAAALPTSIEELMKVPGVGWPETKPDREPHMHGWFLATHKRVFRQLLSRDTRVIIELGSWYGASTEYFAKECPGATVYAVDLWDDDFIVKEQGDHYVDQSLKDMLGSNPLYETFLINLWPHKDRVVPLRMTTLQGLRMLHAAGVKPDIIYIDADHHYEPAKADIKLSLQLFPDAVLVGDDYGNYESVSRAVKECSGEFLKPLHVDANHCWTYAAITSSTGMTHKPIPTTKDTNFKSLLSVFKRGVDNHKQELEKRGSSRDEEDDDRDRRRRSRSRDRRRDRSRSRERRRERSRSRDRGRREDRSDRRGDERRDRSR